jgi:hypothetical protein
MPFWGAKYLKYFQNGASATKNPRLLGQGFKIGYCYYCLMIRVNCKEPPGSVTFTKYKPFGWSPRLISK